MIVRSKYEWCSIPDGDNGNRNVMNNPFNSEHFLRMDVDDHSPTLLIGGSKVYRILIQCTFQTNFVWNYRNEKQRDEDFEHIISSINGEVSAV